MTLTSPHDDGVAALVADLIDRLQTIEPDFPLRVVPLRITVFTPVAQRLAREPDRARSLMIQKEAIAAWNVELDRRFDAALRDRSIVDVPLLRRPR